MKMEFFGDTYDVIKQSFLQWLNDFGKWVVHPMFSENVTAEDAENYSSLLGARVISTEILIGNTNRSIYFRAAVNCIDHLFLDPDIGIRINDNNGMNKQSYIFIKELISIASRSPELLTLVFDQSFDRRYEREQLEEKLSILNSNGIYSKAYVSHTKFILVSCNRSLLENAISTVLRKSRLPSARFI